tara:strand:+ start:406 stop:597 length:192 start_codon:yes stop_codon:yes gene_type:complete
MPHPLKAIQKTTIPGKTGVSGNPAPQETRQKHNAVDTLLPPDPVGIGQSSVSTALATHQQPEG